MRYTAEILPYHDHPFEVAVRELARLGFREVNLWSAAAPLAAHVNPGDDPWRIRAIMDRYGVRPSGMTTYGKSQDEILERIGFAQELGIDTLIFDCEASYPDFAGSFLPPLVEAAERAGIRIAVENHLTVPFSSDFESGSGEDRRWDEGVDTFAQIKRLISDIDHPHLGVCMAPPHLWVMGESITEVATWLAERKRLFYYYLWDIDRAYRRGADGLDFGPGDRQLPRPDGTLDHAVPLGALARLGYAGPVSLKCHGTGDWPLHRISDELAMADTYLRRCFDTFDINPGVTS